MLQKERVSKETPALLLHLRARDFLRQANSVLFTLSESNPPSASGLDYITTAQGDVLYFISDEEGTSLMAGNSHRLTKTKIDSLPEHERTIAVDAVLFKMFCNDLTRDFIEHPSLRIDLRVYKDRVILGDGLNNWEIKNITEKNKLLKENRDRVFRGEYFGEIEVDVTRVKEVLTNDFDKQKPVCLDVLEYRGVQSLVLSQKNNDSIKVKYIDAKGTPFNILPFQYTYLADVFKNCPYPIIKIKHDKKNNAAYFEAGDGSFIHILAHMNLNQI